MHRLLCLVVRHLRCLGRFVHRIVLFCIYDVSDLSGIHRKAGNDVLDGLKDRLFRAAEVYFLKIGDLVPVLLDKGYEIGSAEIGIDLDHGIFLVGYSGYCSRRKGYGRRMKDR
ncbi:MAG: hypothetical protein D6800_06675 [Candidatus Zixiibacteriota bacterium]|nr:MAG: hypothetical protein D6800_06675 [candidate division Zixibacteria bacterium]